MSIMGYLKVIVGPMYSGKTTELLNIYYKYSYNGFRCCLINYSGDTRYHKTMMSTHTNQMVSCINCYALKEIFEGSLKVGEYDIFLINEGQFFGDLKKYVTELIDVFDKRVYVCGLDSDFRRNKFGEILELIPICDEVVKLTAICKECKSTAIFTHRLSFEKEQTIIGSGNYVSLCRECYMKKVF
jgi:thymidine kinase